MGIMRIIRKLKMVGRNIAAYWRIVVSDADWDSAYLLELMEVKFRKMSRFFSSDLAMGSDSDSVAKDLAICADLCKRIRLDEYADAPYEAHYRKWGKLDISIDGHGGYFVFKRALAVTEEQKEQERQEMLSIGRKSDAQRRADLAYLCDLMSRRLLCWWD